MVIDGDLLDAFGVEHVVRIELGDRGLLEIFDGDVIEHVAVEVFADDADHTGTELLALLIQADEIHLLAGGLEGLGELRREQFIELVGVGSTRTSDQLGDLADVVHRGVDPHVEAHPNVGADVVLADQTLVAHLLDLDDLDADIHQLGLVDDREHHRAIEGHFGGSSPVDDQRLALVDLAIEPGDEHADDRRDDRKADHDRGDGRKDFHDEDAP